MKKKSIIFLILFLTSIQSPSALTVNEEPKLTIYTYDTLLAYPGYDFIGNFSAYANIPKDAIKLVTFSDASEIVTRSAVEKDDPQADVLIGIDNVLVHKARNEKILEPYIPSTIANIPNDLIEGLAEDNILTPYDYGVISLFYDKNKLSVSENFTLMDIVNEGLSKKLVFENPLLSSPGLGFLLWTIAELNYTSDKTEWTKLWQDIRDNGRLVDSWGDAFNVFSAEESDRPLMVSYTSSPAFGLCLEGDNSTAALLTKSDGTVRGWQQIEGIGLVKNAKNSDLAKMFIDWFIDIDVQENIYLNQWMYPAMTEIETPECYKQSTYSPNEITPYNSELTQELISNELDNWLDEWEQLYVAEANSLPVISWMIGFSIIALVINRRKNRGT